MRRNSEFSVSPKRLLALLCAIAASGSVSAQTPAPPAPPSGPTPAAQAVDQAPVIRFAAEGITLDEAVRITLQHDPEIKRATAAARGREGFLLTQRGLFDLTLLGGGSYSRRVQELSDSRKQTEIDKRDKVQAQIDDGQIDVKRANDLISLLDRVRTGAPNGQALTELSQISPTIAGTIRVIDQLIANTTDPTQRTEFQSTRDQFILDSRNQLQSELTASLQALTDQESQLQLLGPPPVDEVFIDGSINASLSKFFRSGLSLSPYIDGTFQGSNFKDKPKATELGGKGLQDQYALHAGVNLGVPLARNRGARAVGAGERAALLEHQASQLALEHETSASVLRTVTAYWELRAAQEGAAIAVRAIEFQTRLIALTRTSIASGDLPQVELSRAQASEARERAQDQNAQTRLHQARVALALAMGIASTEDDATLPRARDDFPPAPDAAALQQPVAGLIGQALDGRRDVGAAGKSADAGRTLEESAQINLRPRMDLSASLFFTALDEGNFMKAVDRWVGPSSTVQLQIEKPLGNNTQRGQLMQRQAEAEQLRIAQADLHRQVKLGVVESVGTLQEIVTRLQLAQAAVGFYQTMTESELARFRTGDATLLDTVVTQQQQNDALLTLVAARQELAQRIAELRFQTGTLVSGGAVRAQDLVTIPVAIRRQP